MGDAQALERRHHAELAQRQQRWADGKAAMTVAAGSDVKKFVKQVGVAKVRRHADAQVG